jgi:adenylyl-sulfate kinase
MTARHLEALVLWMSEQPLRPNRACLISHAGQRLLAGATRINSSHLAKNHIGKITLETQRPLTFEAYRRNTSTGSFMFLDPASDRALGVGVILGEGRPAEARSDGVTVWFTGLSAAGKTTINQELEKQLRAQGRRVESLDGDLVRQHLCKGLGYTKQDRDENIRRIGFAAELLTRDGAVVLASAISPYREIRDEIRRRIGRFIEVYVNAPLEVCEQRDLKGLYKKARAGLIAQFTGISDPYEPPLDPEVECRTDLETVSESAAKVLRALDQLFPYAAAPPGYRPV